MRGWGPLNLPSPSIGPHRRRAAAFTWRALPVETRSPITCRCPPTNAPVSCQHLGGPCGASGVGRRAGASDGPLVGRRRDLFLDRQLFVDADDQQYLCRSPCAPDNSWSGPSLIGNGGMAWWQNPNPPPAGAQPGRFRFRSRGLVADRPGSEAADLAGCRVAAHAAPDGIMGQRGKHRPTRCDASTRPSLLARAQSDTVAAWAWTDGTREQVLVARHSGSQWSAPSVVEDAAAADMSFRAGVGPMLAGGRTGDVVLVYSRVNQGALSARARSSLVQPGWRLLERRRGAGFVRRLTDSSWRTTARVERS